MLTIIAIAVGALLVSFLVRLGRAMWVRDHRGVRRATGALLGQAVLTVTLVPVALGLAQYFDQFGMRT
jgi:hypothetical protein